MITITQNHIAEGTALLVSLIFFRSLQKSRLKSLPYFLLFILSVELAGNYFKRPPLYNSWIYNLSIPLEYAYYLYLFRLHANALQRKVTLVSLGILAIVAAWHFITLPFLRFHTPVLQSGQILVIINTCIYIYGLFQAADDQPLYKNAFFWIVSGLFLFNLGEAGFFALIVPILKNKWDPSDELFKLVNNTLLYILYSSYVAAIIVLKTSKR